jgi:polyferredoxin
MSQSMPNISLPQFAARIQHAAAASADVQSPLLRPEERVLSTLNDDGSRRWLAPKVSPGRFWHRRRIVGWALIVVFAVIPWLRLNDKPLILLDVMTRRFVFFGTTFRPTDTLLLALLMLSVFVGIFLLTALFGRVWCGWACPQTVYMEFLYRPIERLFLGAGYGNRKVAVAWWRRAAMYAVFFIVSAHLANTFLAYFVGTDRLVEWTFGSPFAHPTAFAVFFVVTGLMMFDFCFFREQMCTLVCPYGRMQSVLLDRESLIVGYDKPRGEPRGRQRAAAKAARTTVDDREAQSDRKPGCDHDAATGSCGGGCKGGCGSKKETPAADAPTVAFDRDRTADCIDCTLCVQTCPTGIDIRDGLQLECIHCAQCIDACDAVMDKLKRPRGLIRYGTQNGLERTARTGTRLRVVVYPLILVALVSAFVGLLLTRAPAMVVQLRVQGTPYTVQEDGTIANLVRFRIDNRTDEQRTYRVEPLDGVRIAKPVEVVVEPIDSMEVAVHVFSDPKEFVRGTREITLRVTDGDSFDEACAFSLVGPFGQIANSKDGATR